jgi:hypothetical protein
VVPTAVQRSLSRAWSNAAGVVWDSRTVFTNARRCIDKFKALCTLSEASSAVRHNFVISFVIRADTSTGSLAYVSICCTRSFVPAHQRGAAGARAPLCRF